MHNLFIYLFLSAYFLFLRRIKSFLSAFSSAMQVSCCVLLIFNTMPLETLQKKKNTYMKISVLSPCVHTSEWQKIATGDRSFSLWTLHTTTISETAWQATFTLMFFMQIPNDWFERFLRPFYTPPPFPLFLWARAVSPCGSCLVSHWR